MSISVAGGFGAREMLTLLLQDTQELHLQADQEPVEAAGAVCTFIGQSILFFCSGIWGAFRLSKTTRSTLHQNCYHVCAE